MTGRITDIIEGADPAQRDLAVDQWCAGKSLAELLAAGAECCLAKPLDTNRLLKLMGLEA